MTGRVNDETRRHLYLPITTRYFRYLSREVPQIRILKISRSPAPASLKHLNVLRTCKRSGGDGAFQRPFVLCTEYSLSTVLPVGSNIHIDETLGLCGAFLFTHGRPAGLLSAVEPSYLLKKTAIGSTQ